MSETITTTAVTEVMLSHGERMLAELNRADFWHDSLAHTRINKKKKEMHRRYQQAIWWAIQQIEHQAEV